MSNNNDFSPINTFTGSNFGCFLLHQNELDVNYTVHEEDVESPICTLLNPFFIPPVNIRTNLEHDKLFPCKCEKNQSANMLWSAAKATDSGNNPISGSLHIVVGSYVITDPITSPSSSNTCPMSLVLERESTKSPVHATAATPEVFRNALNWILPTEDHSNIPDDDLLVTFVSEVDKLVVPNGSVSQLRQFIQKRNWSGDRLWGGEKDSFLEVVDAVTQEHERWRLYRLYITQNFAWQTKVVFYPVDGLHRIAISDMVYNGISPSIAESEGDASLKTLVNEFSRNLAIPDDNSSVEKTLRLHNATVCIDTFVSLYYNKPDVINKQVCMKISDESAKKQTETAKQSPHTIVHLLSRLVSFCFEFSEDKSSSSFPRYLFDPSSEEPKSLMKLLNQENPTLEFFFECVQRDGFCKDKDDFDQKIVPHMYSPKGGQLLYSKDHPTIYIRLWLEALSKVVYDKLNRFKEEFQNTAGIDPEYVKFKQTMAMEYWQFKSSFMRIKEGKAPKDYLAMFQADYTVHYENVLKLFVTQKKDFFGDDSYCRPIGFGDERFELNKRSYFPSGFLHVLQILIYCHLSPGTHQSVVKFLNKLCNGRGTSSDCQYSRLHSSRQCIKALIATVHISSHHSDKHWNLAMKYEVRKDEKVAKEKLFHPDEVCMKGDDLFISIERESRNVFLVMSAIRHSCEYFGNLGINQEPPLEYKEYVDNYSTHENRSKTFDEVLKRLVEPAVLYTLAFIKHIHTVNLSLSSIAKGRDKTNIHRAVVNHSLSQYMPEGVTVASEKLRTHVGYYTLGGMKTLSPALNRNLQELEVCPRDYESVYEVLHRSPLSSQIGLNHQHPTHKIGQFMKESFDVKDILDDLLSLSRNFDAKDKIDEEEDEEEEEKGGFDRSLLLWLFG